MYCRNPPHISPLGADHWCVRWWQWVRCLTTRCRYNLTQPSQNDKSEYWRHETKSMQILYHKDKVLSPLPCRSRSVIGSRPSYTWTTVYSTRSRFTNELSYFIGWEVRELNSTTRNECGSCAPKKAAADNEVLYNLNAPPSQAKIGFWGLQIRTRKNLQSA